MARYDVIQAIYNRKRLINNFDFDALYHQPIPFYLSIQDITSINKLVTSAKYSGMNKEKKFQIMDSILYQRGFKRFHAGTNRIIFKNEYDDSFLLKIAIDDVGLQDNKDEYINQQYMKPFVPKVFDVTQCGTVEMIERVEPIVNRYEFSNIAEDVFYILENYFLGKYVLEDIGTDFFMNWGIRDGFGPVLLDFPYLYKIKDGKKLICNREVNGIPCHGYIDYDNGLNTLICERCGHRYAAKDIGESNNLSSKSKIIKGVNGMHKHFKVTVRINGRVYGNTTKSVVTPSLEKTIRKKTHNEEPQHREKVNLNELIQKNIEKAISGNAYVSFDLQALSDAVGDAISSNTMIDKKTVDIAIAKFIKTPVAKDYIDSAAANVICEFIKSNITKDTDKSLETLVREILGQFRERIPELNNRGAVLYKVYTSFGIDKDGDTQENKKEEVDNDEKNNSCSVSVDSPDSNIEEAEEVRPETEEVSTSNSHRNIDEY